MNKKLIALIRAKFLLKLNEKTGWGRNDLIAAYDHCVTEALIELMDETKPTN